MRKIYSITLEIHEAMKKELATVLDSLASCGKNKDVCRGFKLHAYLLKNGALIAGSFVADSLAIMYAKCGAHTKAHDLICEFSIDSVMPWTALIAGYIQVGEALKALACYENFQCKGFNPDSIMLTCVAKACGSIGALDKGREIHEKVAKEGLFRNDTVLGTALIDMYAKCGVLVQARQVLDEIQVRDVITWSALIAGFVHHGQGHDAIVCFEEMRSEGVIPNVVTITCILKACSAVKDIHRGVQTHCHITRQGWICKDVLLGNALVEMYAKCSNLVKAQQVLEELPVRNIVSWSALITGYLEVGQAAESLRYSRLMQRDGLLPDALTFACMLKACGMIGAVDYGEQLHHEISRQGLLKCNLLLSTVLMDMYIKCGALHKAHEVINELPLRDTISWNVLLAGYAQLGLGEDALKCFHQMQREGVSLDAVTFTCILKACSSIGAVNKGQEIHHEIARHGFLEENLALKSALVDMYTKFGELSKAQRVLQDLPTVDSVTWSALIAGHALQDEHKIWYQANT
ncbi:hypothetical protein KP509_11G026900 [Ceratopteris richardii]|uniref:Pentatricopeptide repeat-containing protein n=1 Tax=Ceratopteris richardii TaxID=49495 RepID=A0A8T2TN96_CERRI|nr:hypothetical protein KP509_11G026900 [Ceratopteris richardii]